MMSVDRQEDQRGQNHPVTTEGSHAVTHTRIEGGRQGQTDLVAGHRTGHLGRFEKQAKYEADQKSDHQFAKNHGREIDQRFSRDKIEGLKGRHGNQGEQQDQGDLHLRWDQLVAEDRRGQNQTGAANDYQQENLQLRCAVVKKIKHGVVPSTYTKGRSYFDLFKACAKVKRIEKVLYITARQ